MRCNLSKPAPALGVQMVQRFREAIRLSRAWALGAEYELVAADLQEEMLSGLRLDGLPDELLSLDDLAEEDVADEDIAGEDEKGDHAEAREGQVIERWRRRAGVYQQRILQSSKTSMWIRNTQMGITSVVLGACGTLIKDRQAIRRAGFFQGYSAVVWLVISLQAFGGLNVAFILKYADNILKGFAAAFSTVASCILEMIFFQFRPTFLFLVGSTLINIAAYAYNLSCPTRAEEVSPRTYAV